MTKTVYWSPVLSPLVGDNHWNILFIEPQRLLNKVIKDKLITEDERLKNLNRCPAFVDVSKNTFFVENSLTTEFTVVDQEIKYQEGSMASRVLGPKSIIYGLPYIFFCEDDLEMMITSPYFSEINYNKYAILIPGKFNISKWFRPINLEMMLINNKSNFRIEENEHMAYFTFLTEDKVILKRFDINDKLQKIGNTCGTVNRWWKDVPLIKRYDRFLKTKTNRLVMTEIKKQLVD